MLKIVMGWLVVGFIITGSRCERVETFNLGEPFNLQLGQEKQLSGGDLFVQWEELTEDSRCPKYTNCVWEGQAKVKLRLRDEIIALNLREDSPAQARRIIEGYEVRAMSLSPYPEAGQKIGDETYRLEVLVNKKGP